MRAYPDDFRDLFLGVDGESGEERAVRRAVARDVLAELLTESGKDEIAFLNAVYAAQLSGRSLLRRTAPDVARAA